MAKSQLATSEKANPSAPPKHHGFSRFASLASRGLGSPYAFLIALIGVGAWAVSGPFLKYSDEWQLVINTSTTIITFFSVFLIQNSQNREALATQLKLDELIRAIKEARNEIIDMENLSDEELDKVKAEFQQYRKTHTAGKSATASSPE